MDNRCNNCGVSSGTHACDPRNVHNNNLRKTIEQLRAKVAGLEKDLRTKEPMRAVTKIIMEDNDRLDDENTQLQAQLDAIYALPVTALIDVAARDVRLADNVAFNTPTVANIPDIELVVLPPRGEVLLSNSATKEELETAEYVAVYDERSDGDWELYMVLSQYAIAEDPQQLDTLAETYLLIPGGDCDFPSIWSEGDQDD